MTEFVPGRPWWKKKRWAAVLTLWLAGAYPLSYGPTLAFWWEHDGPWLDAAFSTAYRPMESLRYDGPTPVRNALHSYLNLWMPDGWDRPAFCCFCYFGDGSDPPPEATVTEGE